MEIIDHVIIDGNAVYEIDDQCMNQTQATQNRSAIKTDGVVESSLHQKCLPLCLLILFLLKAKE